MARLMPNPEVRSRLKGYFKENLGVPFIITFMVMLMMCAGLLIANMEDYANTLATIAYFFLVIGVFLQFISFIKSERAKSHPKKIKNVD